MKETGFTPATTMFLTSVDQTAYNIDINEYLEKDQMPPEIEPKMDDFGLLPLPYTLNLEDEESEQERENNP